MDLLLEAGPIASREGSKLEFLRKPIVTCDFPGMGRTPCSPFVYAHACYNISQHIKPCHTIALHCIVLVFIVYSATFMCFTTNQFAQKFNILSNLIAYFVKICNIYFK